jgi:hypothetical protein
LAVGLIENLIPYLIANDQRNFREVLKLALNCADAGPSFSRDLARIKRLLSTAEKQRENGTSGATKKNICKAGCCTHYENTVQEGLPICRTAGVANSEESIPALLEGHSGGQRRGLV